MEVVEKAASVSNVQKCYHLVAAEMTEHTDRALKLISLSAWSVITCSVHTPSETRFQRAFLVPQYYQSIFFQ